MKTHDGFVYVIHFNRPSSLSFNSESHSASSLFRQSICLFRITIMKNLHIICWKYQFRQIIHNISFHISKHLCVFLQGISPCCIKDRLWCVFSCFNSWWIRPLISSMIKLYLKVDRSPYVPTAICILFHQPHRILASINFKTLPPMPYSRFTNSV